MSDRVSKELSANAKSLRKSRECFIEVYIPFQLRPNSEESTWNSVCKMVIVAVTDLCERAKLDQSFKLKESVCCCLVRSNLKAD